MNADGCEELRLLIQADVDGELSPSEAARVAVHLDHCAACAQVQLELLALSEHLRQDVPRVAASEALRARVRSRIAAAATPDEHPAQPAPWWNRAPRRRVASFGAGFALAASLALVWVLPGADGLADAVVAGHIRALQPGHLMDVASTDQHTVKPWFDGRLDFAPPVKDLKAEGFPLAGGRLDYVGGRPVGVLVYQRRQHAIDLFVWPDTGRIGAGPADGVRSGYLFRRWSQGGMMFWAVSDVSAQELDDFVRDWRRR